MNFLNRWRIFAIERFNPAGYLAMIFVFSGAHFSLYAKTTGQSLSVGYFLFNIAPLTFASLLFFFKLRLYDEIKDYKFDLKYHPNRPLPRGIISKREVYLFLRIIILIELIIFSFFGLWSFVAILLTVVYSLMMYKEFFLGSWLRSRIFLYAVSHTFVVVLFSTSIFLALFGVIYVELQNDLLLFSFSNWFLFNIFEFGRKTYSRREEIKGVESYSKKYGEVGAVFLSVSMAIFWNSFLIQNTIISSYLSFLILFLLLCFSGMIYIFTNIRSVAKIFRLTCSIFVVVTYAIFLFPFLL